MDKATLRKQLRQRRKSLAASEQASASHSACQLFESTSWLFDKEKFALYFANDGELNLLFITQLLWRSKKQCYLPVLEQGQLTFAEYQRDTTLVTNEYNIAEPAPTSLLITIDELDVIFMPLVGFTKQGERLGMGKGYYDKTLANLNNDKRPLLVGVAHDCQCVDELPIDEWDINVDAVLTPTQLYSFSTTKELL